MVPVVAAWLSSKRVGFMPIPEFAVELSTTFRIAPPRELVPPVSVLFMVASDPVNGELAVAV
jgi:hypothetical protein